MNTPRSALVPAPLPAADKPDAAPPAELKVSAADPPKIRASPRGSEAVPPSPPPRVEPEASVGREESAESSPAGVSTQRGSTPNGGSLATTMESGLGMDPLAVRGPWEGPGFANVSGCDDGESVSTEGGGAAGSVASVLPLLSSPGSVEGSVAGSVGPPDPDGSGLGSVVSESAGGVVVSESAGGVVVSESAGGVVVSESAGGVVVSESAGGVVVPSPSWTAIGCSVMESWPVSAVVPSLANATSTWTTTRMAPVTSVARMRPAHAVPNAPFEPKAIRRRTAPPALPFTASTALPFRASTSPRL